MITVVLIIGGEWYHLILIILVFSSTFSDSIHKANGKGYFLVDPALIVGTDEELTMDCLQCQTVLAKSLGPFTEWKSRLEVAKESGYNMIHFTPLQELGVSNSSYSIRDQLKVNPIFGKDKEITFEEVEGFTRWMCKEWKILTASDLVFNHTSKCSSWLREHPECAYNLENSPHLKPAFILDRIFHYFSMEVCKGEWVNKGVPPEVNSDHHINVRILFFILLHHIKLYNIKLFSHHSHIWCKEG